jgi:hypothetical protein
MSYTIEQRIGDHTYLYEVESFWDPEKKQSRQRRKYLGKKDPESGKPVRPRSQNMPRLCKDYGHVYLLRPWSSFRPLFLRQRLAVGKEALPDGVVCTPVALAAMSSSAPT